MKELILKCTDCGGIHKITFKDGDLVFEHNGADLLILDKSEAHLLMLYLQEHLALPSVSDGLDKAITEELNHINYGRNQGKTERLMRQDYNDGIEAAVKWLELADRNDTNDAKEIRRLKK